MPTFDRVKNTKRNLTWGAVSKLITMVLPFITRTFFIYYLGVVYVGLNSFFVSVVQMLNITEMGFSAAIAYSMYKPVAEGDIKTVAALQNFFKTVYRIVAAIMIVLGACLMPFLDMLVTGDVPADVNLQLAFAIYLSGTVLGYLMFAYKSTLLAAYQRQDVVDKISSIFSIVKFVLQISVVLLFQNFYLYALAIPLITIGGNIMRIIVVNKVLPEYSSKELKKCTVTPEMRKDIFKRVGGLFLLKLGNVTRDSFSVVVISAFLGLTTAGLYNNYFLISTLLISLMTVIVTAMTAPVGNSVATESVEKNFGNFRLFAFLQAMFAGACAVCFVVLAQPFIVLWVGEDLLLPFGTLVLIVANYYAVSMSTIPNMYIDATGIWWKLKGRAAAEMVCNLVLCLVLVFVARLNGVLMAILISALVVRFGLNAYLLFKHYFGLEKLTIFLRDELLYLLATVAISVIAVLLMSLIPDGGIFLWLGKAVLTLVLSLGIEAALFLGTPLGNQALGFIKRVIKR